MTFLTTWRKRCGSGPKLADDLPRHHPTEGGTRHLGGGPMDRGSVDVMRLGDAPYLADRQLGLDKTRLIRSMSCQTVLKDEGRIIYF
jgi:hypothetical protein